MDHTIHADNGIVPLKRYMVHLASKGQTIIFRGSDADHQSAVIKQTIKTVIYIHSN